MLTLKPRHGLGSCYTILVDLENAFFLVFFLELENRNFVVFSKPNIIPFFDMWPYGCTKLLWGTGSFFSVIKCVALCA